MRDRAALNRFAWLSIGAALATITLKTVAYFLTGSVGLLSDAIESLVNLAGAVMALLMLIIAARPADEIHVYGHSKAEYFAGLVGQSNDSAPRNFRYTACDQVLFIEEEELSMLAC